MQSSSSPAPPMLRVRVASAASSAEFRFDKPFRVGRGDDCEVRIQDDYVSRCHLMVTYADGAWQVKDNNSSNGLYSGAERVPSASITDRKELRLGVSGPILHFEVEQPPPPPPILQKTALVNRYFGDAKDGEPMSDRTVFIRQSFQQVQKKQRSKFVMILGAVGVFALALAGVAFYQHRQLSERQAVAQELFYSMKSLDVDISNLEKIILDSNNAQGREQIRKYQERRREMERNYDRFLTTLKVYDSKLSEKDRLIMRVARVLGECELAIPPSFKTEIQNYIAKWQSSPRLPQAIARARLNGYDRRITRELLERNLPPQFFYLALQESGFDPFISGPPTYKGIAKGMWQFIPETGVKYGLKIGPLADFPRPDTGDDRHNWERATGAAVRYLQDLYSTDALASGMLVMASYNWGEDKVIRLIRSLPANARERNFWVLLTKYRDQIPKETYDYVFYIVSAAIIGENPKLFGFNFESPTASISSAPAP